MKYLSFPQKLAIGLNKALEAMQWRGPWRCAAILARAAMRPVLDWYVFHIVETSIQAYRPDPLAFDVRIFDSNDGVEAVENALREISAYQPVPIAQRLRRGDSIAIATVDGRTVGCSWVTFASHLTAPTDLIWILRPGEAVTYGSFVLPEWRGKRVHKSLDSAITEFLRARGIAHNYGTMSTLNPQTLSLLRQANKRVVNTVVFVHVKNVDWKFHYSTQEPLHWRFRLAASATQKLPLEAVK